MKVSDLNKLFAPDDVVIVVNGMLIQSRTNFDPEVEDDDFAVSFNQPGVEFAELQDFEYNFRLGDLKKATLTGNVLNVNDSEDSLQQLHFFKLTPHIPT